ncbi:hypothetical protein JHK82_050442 [Glycine max]|nr:hypothetical protein JHK82_050442 [Glycine max]
MSVQPQQLVQPQMVLMQPMQQPVMQQAFMQHPLMQQPVMQQPAMQQVVPTQMAMAHDLHLEEIEYPLHFCEEVLERAKKSKEKSARQAMEAQGLISKSGVETKSLFWGRHNWWYQSKSWILANLATKDFLLKSAWLSTMRSSQIVLDDSIIAKQGGSQIVDFTKASSEMTERNFKKIGMRFVDHGWIRAGEPAARNIEQMEEDAKAEAPQEPAHQ